MWIVDAEGQLHNTDAVASMRVSKYGESKGELVLTYPAVDSEGLAMETWVACGSMTPKAVLSAIADDLAAGQPMMQIR